jgi:hypothetical protein
MSARLDGVLCATVGRGLAEDSFFSAVFLEVKFSRIRCARVSLYVTLSTALRDTFSTVPACHVDPSLSVDVVLICVGKLSYAKCFSAMARLSAIILIFGLNSLRQVCPDFFPVGLFIDFVSAPCFFFIQVCSRFVSFYVFFLIFFFSSIAL